MALTTDAILRSFQENRSKILEGMGDPAVHDLRVALRRLMTLLRLGRDLWGVDAVRPYSMGLKGLFDATSGLQDEIVFFNTVLEILRRGAGDPAGIAWVRGKERALEALKAKVRAILASPLVPKLVLRTARFLEPHLERSERFEEAMEGAFSKETQKLRKWWKAVSKEPGDDVALHHLRIQSKRVRYELEALPFLIPGGHGRALKSARTAQKVLGDWRDLQWALGRVRKDKKLPGKIRVFLIEALEGREKDLRKKAHHAIRSLGKVFKR